MYTSISVKFTAIDNVFCHSSVSAGTDEEDKSSHSKQGLGLILSGKSSIGDTSTRELGVVEMFLFCIWTKTQ